MRDDTSTFDLRAGDAVGSRPRFPPGDTNPFQAISRPAPDAVPLEGSRVVFGMAADGRAYPDHPGGPRGALGYVVLGPAGLLDFLALRLGLAGPPVPAVTRIATWLAKLDAASGGERFWSAALATDPWSTATATLAWRDSLVEAGWTPGKVSAGRLSDLSAAEAAGAPLPLGRSDVLRSIIDALRGGERVDLHRLDLVDPIAALPSGWGELVEALTLSGVRVSPLVTRRAGRGDTDLARLQRFLQDGPPERLMGDGSLTIIEARTATMAAEAVAEWIAADTCPGRATAVIVPDGDGCLLDHGLSRKGLPILGMSARSPGRGAFQALALAFATAWDPLDPAALVRLLQLPHCPLPQWAATRLAEALAGEPGLGGSAWKDAWAWIEAELPKRDGSSTARARSLALDTWRAWTDGERFDRKAGMPVESALSLCRRTREWASAARNSGADSILDHCASAADQLAAAFSATGRSRFPAVQAERMIAAADEAVADPLQVAQESELRGVINPGAIWGEVAALVWWSFGQRPVPPRPPWTAAERNALEAVGCRLDNPTATLDLEVDEWRRAILNVDEALVFVVPQLNGDTEHAAHPLMHLASPLLADAPVRFAAETLLETHRLLIGSRVVTRRPEGRRSLPSPSSEWSIPAGLAARARGRVESATTLSDLLACPLKWLLRSVAGLRPGGEREIPSTERLIGNLAHAVALATFLPGRIPDPNEFAACARAATEDLVDRVAAPLRLPGQAAELAFALARIPESLATLAGLLSRQAATVISMETEREHGFGDVTVRGRMDMVVRGLADGDSVIDFKWTSFPGRRRRELAEGRAIQLAIYGRLIDPRGGASAAYYLLRQRTMIAPDGTAFAAEEVPANRSLDETWKAIKAEAAETIRLAAGGHVAATGVPGPRSAETPRFGSSAGAPCSNCDMRTLCRIPRERGR